MKTIAENGPELSGFRGIDNVDAPHKFPKRGGTFLQLAINCDVDDNGQIRRAGGLRLLRSGVSHSAWADSFQEICLFIKNGQLIKLNKDETETNLTSVSPDARMSFVEVLDKVFFSNSFVIGYYKGGSLYSIPEVDQQYKHPMGPGHLLEWYGSRLYVAKDSLIMFSDATVPMYYDSRAYRIPMPGFITMMKAAEDGLYVSTLNDGTYFLAGKDPSAFEAIKITDSYAYLGSAISVQGEDLTGPQKDAVGTVVLWTSSEGVWMGMPGGKVKSLTGNYYLPVEEDIQAGGCAVSR